MKYNIFQCRHRKCNLGHCDGPTSIKQRREWQRNGLWAKFLRQGDPVDEVKAISELNEALGIKFRIRHD